MKNFFIGNEEKALKSSFLWNSIWGLLNAGQSVIILMVLARTNGAYDAGIFSIAYATACLCLTVGNYGMRSFQATDINSQFSFNTYLSSRIITSLLMIVVSVLYCGYGFFFLNYDFNKLAVIMMICLIKLIDAIEDVYYGMYQSKNRLDIGAKGATIRQLFTLIILCAMLVFTSDLLISSTVTFVLSLILALYFIMITVKHFKPSKFQFEFSTSLTLLKTTFGVFISAFLALYIVNAPKYSIDAMLSQELQAYYTYIAMPVFVVGLLNNFLYQPILVHLADMWNKGEIKKFTARIFRQILIISALTFVTIVGAYFLGIPVLSVLYSADLSEYKIHLLILLLGGGFLAVSGFITVVITIIRKQKDLIIGYISASVIALLLSQFLVSNYAITGAVLAYTISIFLLTLVFIILLMYRLKTQGKPSTLKPQS